MLRNNLKIAIRHLFKNKSFAAINIFGLALGIMACLIIAQYVNFNLSFDRHLLDSNNIYRINNHFYQSGKDLGNSALTSPAIAPALAKQQPYVSDYTRFWGINYMNNSIIYHGDKGKITFEEPKVYFTDKSSFGMFDLALITGTSNEFDAPYKMVMTKSAALKYFPMEKAVGEQVELSGNFGSVKYEVVGIIKDLPENTHFDFDILLSFPSVEANKMNPNSWTSNNNFSYLKIEHGTDLNNVQNDIQKLSDDHSGDKLNASGYISVFTLQSIADIHLFFDGGGGFKIGASYQMVYALALIALVILVIAWINYLNLSLIKTLERSKEIGIRRVFGSTNKMMTGLFTSESFLITLIAFLIALTLAQLTSSFLHELTEFKFEIFKYPQLTLGLFLLIIVGSLIAGSYPALISRAFKTSDLLLGKKLDGTGKLGMKKFLIGFQFVITFILVAVTLTVHRQISFMRSADLGIDINNTLVLNAPPSNIFAKDNSSQSAYTSFRTALTNHPFISKFTNSGEIPGVDIGWTAGAIRLKNHKDENSINSKLVAMGIEFHDFFNIELLAGRYYIKSDNPFRNGNVVINEKMSQMLGFEKPEDALNAKLDGFHGSELNVVGVVENHHHTSLQNEINPIIYILSSFTEFYFVKLNNIKSGNRADDINQLKSKIEIIENEWYGAFKNEKFDYFFLDESFNQQYKADENFGKLFGAFSLLAICIACLGLYGLFSFFLHQKIKEIGIRKVLGANASNIIMLLTKSYVFVVLISFLIAAPVFWYVSQLWLENYSYRIPIDFWMFAIPLIVVLFISVLSISVRLLKSVNTNPIDSLKYE